MRTVRHMAVYDMGNMRPPKKKITRYLELGGQKDFLKERIDVQINMNVKNV